MKSSPVLSIPDTSPAWQETLEDIIPRRGSLEGPTIIIFLLAHLVSRTGPLPALGKVPIIFPGQAAWLLLLILLHPGFSTAVHLFWRCPLGADYSLHHAGLCGILQWSEASLPTIPVCQSIA